MEQSAKTKERFSETNESFTMLEAINEAKRCLHCKAPQCSKGCPISQDIPDWIHELSMGNLGNAMHIINGKSNLPAVCGRVCPHERQCEGHCVLGKKGRPVAIGKLERFVADFDGDMQLIRERIGNLNVKSPIDGEVGLLDIVLGQSVSTGQKIGQINDLSGYKVEAQIDESYIDRVRAGLEATFDRQGTDYKVRLRKVYPEVRSGQFRADFTFLGDHPENIRSGQTYYLHLELGQPTEAVIIPRGSFYQTTGGAWIYVLAPEGDKAYKRPIRIGRQNPQYYEVLDGLEPGERVIVSGYENYGSNDVLILNK